MSDRPVANLAASVRRRLLNLSRRQSASFDLILSRFANERLLYRLSQSPFVGDFVLKGAMLFTLWRGEPHRPTRDLDLLGFGPATTAHLEDIFRTLCAMDCAPDGLVFDTDSIQIRQIRAGQEYGGLRVVILARLEQARIPVQIDIGFGDDVVPPPKMVDFPTLLNFPPPRLRVYPRETVVAEKLHAMVILGMLNSRMKDFYDLWFMLHVFKFSGPLLQEAIIATFQRRNTLIPSSTPVALSEQFAAESDKVTQWSAFIRRNRLVVGDEPFAEIVSELRGFLAPVLISIHEERVFNQHWSPNGPWI